MLTSNQKQGMLIFDDICVRESISVNSKTLNYSGLEDFGEDVKSSGLKANHCLVFIFQSLAANISHPIAVFASRGPVKGNIILHSIVHTFNTTISLRRVYKQLKLMLYI